MVVLVLILIGTLGCAPEQVRERRSSNQEVETIGGSTGGGNAPTSTGDPIDQPSGSSGSGGESNQGRSYQAGIKMGDLLPPIVQSNLVPKLNRFHGLAKSSTGQLYVAGVDANLNVQATGLERIGINAKAQINDIVDLGAFGIALTGSLYRIEDSPTNLSEAQANMNVIAIIDPDGGVSLIDQTRVGRTDQVSVSVSAPTFDGINRLYFLVANRLCYIELENRETLAATSDALAIDRYDIARATGKIYLRARDWRSTNRVVYELMPDLSTRKLFNSISHYNVREDRLVLPSGLYQNLNTWGDHLLRSSVQLGNVTTHSIAFEFAGFRVPSEGAFASTFELGPPPTAEMTPLNVRLLFDGVNIFGIKAAGGRLKVELVEALKYPVELSQSSSLSSATISKESIVGADSEFWISFGDRDSLVLLRYANLSSVPERFIVPGARSGSKIIKVGEKRYLYTGNNFQLMEISGETLTLTPVDPPKWSAFKLAHEGQFYDTSNDRVLKYNFATESWDEVSRIIVPGCSVQKNLLTVGPNGRPLGIVQLDCASLKGVYAVAYQSWENLDWESSTKRAHKAWEGSTRISAVRHVVSQDNLNVIRVDGAAVVMPEDLSTATVIDLKMENVEFGGWVKLQLPSDFDDSSAVTYGFAPNRAVMIESITSPQRRAFFVDLSSGLVNELEAFRGLDLTETLTIDGQFLISGQKSDGTESVSVIVTPDQARSSIATPRNIDLIKMVKRLN